MYDIDKPLGSIESFRNDSRKQSLTFYYYLEISLFSPALKL